jgi:hypothetical protein
MCFGFRVLIVKSKLLIATGITAAVLAGLWVNTQVSTPKTGCVNLVVDYGDLPTEETAIDSCVSLSDGDSALDLVKSIGLKITGTDKYGDQIVCLVNGLPKKADCSDMPPEDAYWAILVRRPGAVSEWGWADKGISDLKLNAGDSLGLVFTVDGEVRWPE